VGQNGWRKFVAGVLTGRLKPASAEQAAAATEAYKAFLATNPTPRWNSAEEYDESSEVATEHELDAPPADTKRKRVRAPREQPTVPTHSRQSRTLTLEQQQLLGRLRSSYNKPLLVVGRAGTGKTTFVRRLQQEFAGRVVTLAPTGVAAREVGGQTIHSFFALPTSVLVPEAISTIAERGWRWRGLLRKAELLIIDEISMVRPDVLDTIDRLLRDAKSSDAPFGGQRVLMIGDLLQLPPVANGDDSARLFNLFGTNEPLAIDAEVLRDASTDVMGLTRVFRQTDETFVRLLNRVRQGTFDEEDSKLLAARVYALDEEELATRLVLTARNATADERNAREMSKLPGRTMFYSGSATGTYASARQDEARLPAPIALALRLGARVMLLRNDSEGRWVNGSMGEITAFEENRISVLLEDTETPVEIERAVWEDTVFDIDEATGAIVQRVRGTFTQFPVRPAWAVTVHKAQGQTYSRAHIDLAGGAFAPGQLYVALSRCRTLEGLTLERPVTSADVRVNRRAVEFLRNCAKGTR
jgi:ATP-dependent exoDNAse (exonuclease V) alpha subunit